MGQENKSKTLEYWKNNAEEDYRTTPISVLKYIGILESLLERVNGYKPHVSNCAYTSGQKVKVLIGCVWQNAEVEKQHEDPNYYLCGTNDWSTVFHINDIKAN